MQTFIRAAVCALMVAAAGAVQAAETIRIALIDPLSGPEAELGQSAFRHLSAAVDFANLNGGALGLKLEVVPFDNQGRPEQSLEALRQSIERGIRLVAQGVGSDVARALMAAVNEHNERNPGRSVLLINVGAGDPALTGAECSYWHFRFDAHLDMKAQVLAGAIARNPAIESVYLVNRDNAAGRRFAAEAARLLPERRAGLRIAGSELHAGDARDFAPIAARIAASGAHAVATANIGEDLAALLRAARKAGVDASFYTLHAEHAGTPQALAQLAPVDVRNVTAWHPNIEGNRLDLFAAGYRALAGENWHRLPVYLAVHMLVTAMETARGLEPARIVAVLEGLSFLGPNGPIAMRKDDHQLLQPLCIARLAKIDANAVSLHPDVKDYGWVTEARVDTEATVLPTDCRMARPGRR